MSGNRLIEKLINVIDKLSRYRTFVMSLAVIVVFVTTYLLILPAFTLEKEKAAEQGGIDLPGIESVSQDSIEDADISDDRAAIILICNM